ncbi:MULTISPECIES: hypothetical protein [Acidiplasma]|uniref:KaiC-like domain-containing protein n=2 Tax=Acidiplasma TaxID=507753 RepID=A0A0Q0RNC1_9ARCH|nr:MULTISPECIES: hypothetical protein [Acidiplasma]KPV46138.1 hypothetical protein SE19_06855 [Acidiplasma aeolicum]KQB33711.1 hypothetical protein AOG55_02245 [Acidiplasma cupricumulans]KQB34315.1 hypothetical protein AOG54_05220 [Acidiplasma aeolicum]
MGFLRIIKTDRSSINSLLSRYKIGKILISDGIILDKTVLNYDVKIQRILTPYQLENILINSHEGSFLIVISTITLESWDTMELSVVSDLIRRMVAYGNDIVINLAGPETLNCEMIQ